MGGLWVDYNLMSTIQGLYVIGEANFGPWSKPIRSQRTYARTR